MLQVEALHKSFEDFKAVNGARLTVAEGQTVAVIGPNGAGKTTLFNLIAGQLKPDQGRILFCGEDITALPAHQVCRRGVARSFQIVNIFPRLTVFENVQVAVLAQQGRSIHLFPPVKNLAVAETESILDSTGLLAKADHLAGALSHGDQKVLEMAIALGSQPRLLILDEPTAGMSPEETQATLDLIRRLAQTKGITILFCEHDMDVVFSVAQSIMVMHQGQTLIQGTPEEVRNSVAVQEAYLGAA